MRFLFDGPLRIVCCSDCICRNVFFPSLPCPLGSLLRQSHSEQKWHASVPRAGPARARSSPTNSDFRRGRPVPHPRHRKKEDRQRKENEWCFCKVTREEGGGISPGRGGAGPKENEFGRAGRTRPKSLWIGADRAVLGFSSVVWAFKKKPSNAFFFHISVYAWIDDKRWDGPCEEKANSAGILRPRSTSAYKATVLPRKNDVPHKELVVNETTPGLQKKKRQNNSFFRDIYLCPCLYFTYFLPPL